ncbi:MAG: 3-oxoadipate CoA-transferase, beta subunit [Mycobacterium sp.]|nr:3-oxoadipate CoA-transferase, beta subunit [Mycobacterium sp.]
MQLCRKHRKLMPQCTYPLTGLRCVSRVCTDHGVFHVDPTGDGHVQVTETFGIGVAALAERMQLDLDRS